MDRAMRSIPDDGELAYQWNSFLTDLLPRLKRDDCARLLELSKVGKLWLDRMDRIAIQQRITAIEAIAKAEAALHV